MAEMFPRAPQSFDANDGFVGFPPGGCPESSPSIDSTAVGVSQELSEELIDAAVVQLGGRIVSFAEWLSLVFPVFHLVVSCWRLGSWAARDARTAGA